MKHYYFPVSILGVSLFVIGIAGAQSEQAAQYHKAGEVGAFSADVEIPADVNADTTVFTAQASNEKVYLLYVQPPQSMAERLKRMMEPGRREFSEEERQIRALRVEIEEKRSVEREDLRKAGNELIALKLLREGILKEDDKALLEKIEQKIAEWEAKVAELKAADKSLNEQMEDTYRIPIPEQSGEAAMSAEQAGTGAVSPEQAGTGVKVVGRFRESGEVRIEVYARDSDELLAEPKLIATVGLELPGADIENPAILKDWATAQGREYMISMLDSPYTSYYQYCLLQSREKYGLQKDVFLLGQQRQQRQGPDLYAMTTGALAIQESLQLEEMTGRGSVPAERTVAIESLQGPNIKSHPFEEMMQGREFSIFPVDSLIPYDNYYCHFTSISKQIAASDLMKQWGTSLLRAASVTARDADLPARYQDQLCIDISTLTRLFGDLVIGEIAITGGDPFLREGSDMAVVIQVKNRPVFDEMMKNCADKALIANPGAGRSASSYNGIAIESIASADHSICSHSAYMGDYKVYSNSVDTLKLIVDTHAGKRQSMAENADFKYMRTIFPGKAEAEDGFIYMSDAFIRKLLSARWKIEAQRRIICQNHLRMTGNAATMCRTETGKQASVDGLIEGNYLSEKVTQCPDNGTYSLDESGRAFCSVHNCLQYCTPIASVAIDKAAEIEADDYKRFVGRYNNFWSRYFDPIGIRFKLGNRIEVETCILPLIENSIYNQLREIVGGEPVALNSQLMTDGTIASLGAKLNLDGNLTGQLQMMQQKMFPNLPAISTWMGDNVSLHFYDSDVLFTFSESGMNMFGGWMNMEDQIVFGLIASAINLPVYAAIELKDEALAETFIRELLKVAQRQMAAQGGGDFSEFGIEPYSDGEYKGHKINTLACQLFVIKFRLHYAVAANRLIISTKRYVLEKALDAAAAGEPVETANLELKIKPTAFDKLRPIVRLGWQERMREACLKNVEPVRALIECCGATEKTLNDVSRKTEGVILRCPSGGTYKYDEMRDIVYCSVHGNRNHPKQPTVVNENEGLMNFLGRMNDFSASFRFTEEGIMTKVVFDLESTPQAKK